MARPRRIHLPGAYYHVILRGNHRQDIFFERWHWKAWEQLLADALARFEATLHAYCWMPNHVHLLLQAGPVPLGQVVHAVAPCYARAVQKRLATSGHMFERRYRSILVTDIDYLFTLLRYIHLNPVRAALAGDALGYRHSSHAAYLGRRSVEWLRTETLLGMLGPELHASRSAYARLMAMPCTDDELARCRGEPKAVLDTSSQSTAKSPAIRQPSAGQAPRMSLEEFAATRAAIAGVSLALLKTNSRCAQLVQLRRAIALEALSSRIATLSDIAILFGRTPQGMHAVLYPRGAHPELRKIEVTECPARQD